MSFNNPTKIGNFKDVDAAPSTEWGLLSYSRRKYQPVFELLNIKTGRAHKLAFMGVGTDEITVPTEWTKGSFYQKFKTDIPMNFDGFHEKLAMLTPGNSPLQMDHIFRIGSFAKIKIEQSYGELFGKWQLFGNCKIVYGSGNRTIPLIFARPSYVGGEFSLNYSKVEHQNEIR